MASGFTVNLSDYVYENRDLLIKDIVLGFADGDTIRNLTKQLGVKSKEMLNYLNVDPALQNGRGCGFNASGTTEFTEREVETAIIKVNDQWCPDDLLNKYYEYEVRIGANQNAEHLPFEAEIMGGIVRGINKKLEKLVWQGDKSQGDLIDGFLTQALGADSASTITAATANTIYGAVKNVVLAIPEEIYDKAVVFLAPALYRAYIQELVEKNYFHYDPANGEPVDMFFPGTSIKVHKTMGLEGDKRHIYASTWENMVYATDLLDNKEEVRAWFSDDDDLHKVKIKWNSGVATLFPDAVVVSTAASDLV